jgi:2-C-methyl-D-erythritol 4-phosphate cytidylyltransferase
MQVDAVIVAAGSSTRFGEGDKLTANLRGKPVLGHAIAALAGAASVRQVIIVTSPGRMAEVAEIGSEFAPEKFKAAVAGGARRRDSVEAGVQACSSKYVLIHDGARPLATPALIDAVVAAAEGKPGAIAATPVTDTIKEVQDSTITGHPDRSRLWAAQTPQVVLRRAWLDAAGMGDNDETDDAAMLSRLGLECVVVEGSTENLKITRPLDLELAAAILARRGEQP